MSIYRKEELKEVTIEHDGEQIKLKIRELSWMEMNKILSKCTSFGGDKRGVFDLDTYFREALQLIIVEAPWGKTTSIEMSKWAPEFGQKLEELVPLPGAAGGNLDFFEQESK